MRAGIMQRIVVGLALAVTASACVERVVVREPVAVDQPSGQVVAEEPPPPRVEVIEKAPAADQVWVGGFWTWHHGGWEWRPGHFVVKPHTRAVWIAGYWKKMPHGWAWVPGHWS